MACITCKPEEEQLAMKEEIKKLAAQGKNANLIAAMLNIHKEYVVEVLSASSTVSTAKSKKSKVEEDGISDL